MHEGGGRKREVFMLTALNNIPPTSKDNHRQPLCAHFLGNSSCVNCIHQLNYLNTTIFHTF